MWRMVMLGGLIACSHNEPKPAAPAPPPASATTTTTATPAAAAADPAPCDEVAEHVIRGSRTSGDTKPVTQMMRRRCTDDLWSLEARRCYLLSNSWDEALACEGKLSEAQVKALEADIKAMGSTMAHPAPQPINR